MSLPTDQKGHRRARASEPAARELELLKRLKDQSFDAADSCHALVLRRGAHHEVGADGWVYQTVTRTAPAVNVSAPGASRMTSRPLALHTPAGSAV